MHTYELVCVWLSVVKSRLDWQVVHDNVTTVGKKLDDQRLSEEISKLEVELQDKFSNKPFFDEFHRDMIMQFSTDERWKV